MLGALADPGGAAGDALLSTGWQTLQAICNPRRAKASEILMRMTDLDVRTSSVPMTACADALDRRPGCIRIVAEGSEVCFRLLLSNCRMV